MSLKTLVTLAGFQWETGKQIVDAEVTLGSAEKSSSCKVTLADPSHIIAAAIINHSVSNGGIQALERTKTVTNQAPPPVIPGSTSGSSVASVPAGNGTIARGAAFSPEILAALDTVAKKETSSPNTLLGYYQNNGVGSSVGQFTDADIAAGGGFPKSAGRKYNVGRYQFNRGDWEDAKKAGYPIKGYSPVEQDMVALWKLDKANRGGKQIRAGDVDGFIKRAGEEWASVPGSPYGQVQAGTTKAEYVNYYKQRLAFYQGKATATATKAETKVNVTPVVKPKPPATTATPAAPIIKGSILSVNIEGIAYDFVHQGTEMSEAGLTVLVGQGLRWVMSRRKRNATYKDLTLKDLATKVAKEHKLTLDYQATYNPTYEHLDQSGISDYKLLLREVEENGLLITEDKKAIVIKERNQLKASTLVLSRGVNLISYNITDKAVSAQDDEVSKLLPQEAKTFIDPVEGKAVSTKKDVDPNAGSGKPTGKAKPATKGVLKTEQPKAVENRAATKRVGGLPSIFTIPMTTGTLGIQPLSTVLTNGFPGVLDRIWVIKKITHKVGDNVTILDLVSPIEVLDTGSDTNAPVIPGIKAESSKGVKGFVYPVTGITTSLQSANRNGRPHKGCDIAATEGTIIYAVADGVVAVNQFEAGGAGNYVTLKHDGGFGSNYFHMVELSPLKVGATVKREDPIGKVGNTGGSRGAHLHFEILVGGSLSTRGTVAQYFPKLGKKLNSIMARTPV